MRAARRVGRLGRTLRLVGLVARVTAGVVALHRLARAASAAPPVRPQATPQRSIGVVIPARDEAGRIRPLLDAIVGAPGVAEVVVVDDGSTDRTAELARAAGASVVDGSPPPAGWAGKSWALQQGIEAASAEWIVTLDADTRPDPRLPTALVARAIGDELDLLTVGGRFDCPTAGGRWLHAAMLTTLVYRFGPPGTPTPPGRAMANGQCMTFHRTTFLDPDRFDAAGMAPVAGDVVEDIALARHLAANGARVAFLDASELLSVRMFESLSDTWRGWSRSLALPGVESRPRQLGGLAVVLLGQAIPLPRLLGRLLLGRALGRTLVRRRGVPLDVALEDAFDVALDIVLVVARLGTLVGTRRAYSRNDGAYWLSPLADLPAAAAIALGIRRGTRQTWRGRHYT